MIFDLFFFFELIQQYVQELHCPDSEVLSLFCNDLWHRYDMPEVASVAQKGQQANNSSCQSKLVLVDQRL
jgi:hypothetical protein